MLINKIVVSDMLKKDEDNGEDVFSKEAILCIIELSKFFDLFLVTESVKKFFKHIFLYSFTSSIQSCKNNQEKKFAQILHFRHLNFY
jgi:hypothetical protein